MSEQILVWPIGGLVLLPDGVPATIIGACIRRGPHVTYECAYWATGQRFTAWVEAEEITPRDWSTRQQEVGFLAPG